MNMQIFDVEVTDTFAGEANYSWARRYNVCVPELTHYGYDGALGYAKAVKAQHRELMRRAKAAAGYTGVRGTVSHVGGDIEFRPRGQCVVMFITYREPQA